MTKRSTRVNELILREVNLILRQEFQDQSIYITAVEVEVSPDLRHARVFYSVLGPNKESAKAAQFFKQYGVLIRQKISKKIVLKYTPELRFVEDHSAQRGIDLIKKIDELGLPENDS